MKTTSRHLLSATVTLVAALTVGTGVSAASTPHPAKRTVHAPSVAPTGRMVQRVLASQMLGSSARINQSQAVTLAQQFDVIVGWPAFFGPYVAAMRQANPKLVLLAYVNGVLDYHSTDPSSWYLYDARGARVVWTPSSSYAMNPAVTGWVQNVTASCQSEVAATGADGCMIDQLGPSLVTSNSVSAPPVNPATRKLWSGADWLKATSALASSVAAAIAPRVAVANGISSGSSYFDPIAPTSQLLYGAEAGMAEAWLRGATQSIASHPSFVQWKQNVDALVDAGTRGRNLMVQTKTWVAASSAQISAWHKFALASFLLGTDGRAYFEFTGAGTPAAVLGDNPWDHVDVGTPTGSYRLVGAVYSRAFTKGLSVVNPSAKSVQVTLGGTYRTLDGAALSTLTLPPYGGEVLVH